MWYSNYCDVWIIKWTYRVFWDLLDTRQSVWMLLQVCAS